MQVLELFIHMKFKQYFTAYHDDKRPNIISFDLVYNWKNYLQAGMTTALENHLTPHYFKFLKNSDSGLVEMYYKDLPEACM